MTPEVSLFIPCLINHFYPETGRNVVTIFEKLGYKINLPENQTCCGIDLLENGEVEITKKVAEKFLFDYQTGKHHHHNIVCSSRCSKMIINYYPKLFHNTVSHNMCNRILETTKDIYEFIKPEAIQPILSKDLNYKFLWVNDCYAPTNSHEKLRDLIKGITWVYPDVKDMCCGGACMMPTKQHGISEKMAAYFFEQATEKDVDGIICSSDLCRSQLDNFKNKFGTSAEIFHLLDIVVQAIS